MNAHCLAIKELLTSSYVSITVLSSVTLANIPGRLHSSRKLLDNNQEFHDQHNIPLELIAMYWLDIVFHFIG